MNPKAAFGSLRVRVTPLVLSGVAMGISAATPETSVKWSTALFLILTAVFLQFVRNLSNVLGDFLKGLEAPSSFRF